jgi:hypothetical protein
MGPPDGGTTGPSTAAREATGTATFRLDALVVSSDRLLATLALLAGGLDVLVEALRVVLDADLDSVLEDVFDAAALEDALDKALDKALDEALDEPLAVLADFDDAEDFVADCARAGDAVTNSAPPTATRVTSTVRHTRRRCPSN